MQLYDQLIGFTTNNTTSIGTKLSLVYISNKKVFQLTKDIYITEIF